MTSEKDIQADGNESTSLVTGAIDQTGSDSGTSNELAAPAHEKHTQVELERTEPAQTEPDRTEPAQVEPVPMEPARARPIVPLLPYQRDDVESDARFRWNCWARQTGKSFTKSLRRLLRGLVRRRNQVFLSAGERQARELIDKTRLPTFRKSRNDRAAMEVGAACSTQVHRPNQVSGLRTRPMGFSGCSLRHSIASSQREHVNLPSCSIGAHQRPRQVFEKQRRA